MPILYASVRTPGPRRTPCLLGALLAAIAGAAPAAGQSARYHVRDLGQIPSSNVCPCFHAMGISNAGHITGQYFAPDGERRSFLWHEGVMVDIGTLGQESQAFAVNDAGVVTGYSVDAQDLQRGFRYQNGVMTDLGVLRGGVHANGNDINNAGWIAGMSQQRRGNETLQRAALWGAGPVIDLGTFGGVYAEAHGINDAGSVVGWAWDPSWRQCAFLWTAAGGLRDLGTLGGVSAIAAEVNDAGAVVGTSHLPNGSRHAFYWTAKAGMIDLGVPPGATDSSAAAVNGSGQVVGNAYVELLVNEPLLWEGRQLFLLNALIEPGTGWRLTGVQDINDFGQIAATAKLNGGPYRAVMLVPEFQVQLSQPAAR